MVKRISDETKKAAVLDSIRLRDSGDPGYMKRPSENHGISVGTLRRLVREYEAEQDNRTVPDAVSTVVGDSVGDSWERRLADLEHAVGEGRAAELSQLQREVRTRRDELDTAYDAARELLGQLAQSRMRYDRTLRRITDMMASSESQ